MVQRFAKDGAKSKTRDCGVGVPVQLDPPLSLRPVDEQDHDFLLHLYTSTREDLTAVDLPHADQLVRMQFAAQAAHYRQAYPHSSHDVVLLRGEPIGRLYVNRGSDESVLVDISLLTENRGCGWGTPLIIALQADAQERKSPVSLHVSTANSARELYQRLGFIEIANDGVYARMRWSYE